MAQLSSEYKGIVRVNAPLTMRKRNITKMVTISSEYRESSSVTQTHTLSDKRSSRLKIQSKTFLEFGLQSVLTYSKKIIDSFDIDLLNVSFKQIEDIKSKDCFTGRLLFLLKKVFLDKKLKGKFGEDGSLFSWSYKSLDKVYIINKTLQWGILRRVVKELKEVKGLKFSQWKHVLTSVEQMFIEQMILGSLPKSSDFGVFDVFK